MSTKQIQNISCVIIVKNGVHTIKKTLDSLLSFGDVVVYDNGSTDGTLEIIKDYANINLVQGDFSGFGETKNRAVTFAKNDWVLSLDADEVLSKEFVYTLGSIALDENSVYSIVRENYYKTVNVKHCWSNDVIVRVFNRTKTRFTDDKVHEKVIDKGFAIVSIDDAVKHYPYSTISDFILKIDRYSTLFAQERAGKQSSSPLKAFLNATFTFVKSYLIKRGFLDGYAGLIISVTHATNNFFKYMKLYELNKNL